MKKTILFVFAILSLLSCETSNRKETMAYYVIIHPKEIDSNDPNEPPPPPPPPGRPFYGTDNFILLPGNRIFYYKQPLLVSCWDYYSDREKLSANEMRLVIQPECVG